MAGCLKKCTDGYQVKVLRGVGCWLLYTILLQSDSEVYMAYKDGRVEYQAG